MHPRHRVVLAAGLFLILPVALPGQSYAQQVWDQLQVHYRAVAKTSSDWVLVNYVMGHLREDATEGWTFNLTKGRDYIVTGACDNDCSDVNLKLLDPNSQTVAEDSKPDDTPVLVYHADQDGNFTVSISIKSCKESPCYFGFGVFTK